MRMTSGRSDGRSKGRRRHRSGYPAASGADSYHQVDRTVTTMSARSFGVGARTAGTWPQAGRGRSRRGRSDVRPQDMPRSFARPDRTYLFGNALYASGTCSKQNRPDDVQAPKQADAWYAANERRFAEKWGWTPPPTDPP